MTKRNIEVISRLLLRDCRKLQIVIMEPELYLSKKSDK